jgi:hypothetical protein
LSRPAHALGEVERDVGREAGVEDRHRAARDERQLPGDVRLLPVRVLRHRHLEGVLPGKSGYISLMLTFVTFGAGFLMRPLGAVILGAYIDRIGRRAG